MDISGTTNLPSPSATLLRNDPNSSNLLHQASENQKQTLSVDKVTTQQPVQQINAVNEDIVNTRISEHQSLSSGNQVTADEALGSLIDVRI